MAVTVKTVPPGIFVMSPHDGVTIPRGVMHKPNAHGRTVVLMVEPAAVVPTGD